MKKITLIVCTLILALTVSLGTATVAFAEQSPSVRFTSAEMEADLSAFVVGELGDGLRDRTAFSDAEKKAAEYIKNQLSTYGYSEADGTIYIQPITEEVEAGMLSKEKMTFSTQNVIATYNPGKPQTVVIGANYDNLYSGISELGINKTESEHVMAGATAVVTLLDLAEEFASAKPALDYSVVFAFFGACEVGVVGSSHYVDEIANPNNVLLMINLDSLAGETITLYSDEVDTNENALFINNGNAYATNYERLTRTLPLNNQSQLGKLDYSHAGLLDDHLPFYEKNIPVVSFKGGKLNGFSLEYYSTPTDKYESFIRDHEGYGNTMADTASLVYGTLTAADFTAKAATFRDKTDISFFMGGYWAYVVMIGVIVVLALVLILVVKLLEKKYPYQPHKQINLKVAVFGMDYENKTDNDIYVDVRTEGDEPAPLDPKDIDPFE